MKSNCKEVKEKVRSHIKEMYEEYGLQGLRNDVEAIKDSREIFTDYQALYALAKAGNFIHWTQGIVDFLNGLGINPENKTYSNTQSEKLYYHLIARDGVLLIKNLKTNY